MSYEQLGFFLYQVIKGKIASIAVHYIRKINYYIFYSKRIRLKTIQLLKIKIFLKSYIDKQEI